MKGIAMCALEIWALSLAGVLGVAGELLMLPSRILVAISEWIVDSAQG